MIRLLDVNVLMALLWENHEQHEQARRWLQGVTEFATCPISQLGFARVSSHPMLGFSLSPEQAFSVLRRFLADPRHRFIADDLSCEDRVVLTERIPNANAVPTIISPPSRASTDSRSPRWTNRSAARFRVSGAWSSW